MNQEIKLMSIQEIIGLNIELPNIQRIIVPGKIENIVEYQLNNLKKSGIAKFFGTINIHKLGNNHLLVDGQHRYRAACILYNDYSHNVKVAVEIITVSTYEELEQNYQIINKNTSLPELPPDLNITAPYRVCEHFKKKYENTPKITYWSEKTRTRRPTISFNIFIESVATIMKDTKCSEQEIIDAIQHLNDESNTWNIKDFKTKISLKSYHFAKRNNFTIGLFDKNNEGLMILNLNYNNDLIRTKI